MHRPQGLESAAQVPTAEVGLHVLRRHVLRRFRPARATGTVLNVLCRLEPPQAIPTQVPPASGAGRIACVGVDVDIDVGGTGARLRTAPLQA